MALKPTIFKLKITLADTDRDYYDTLNLTVAQHPSESLERMMARVLAFCIHAEKYPVFTKGLCAVEEPDIWARTLDDRISLWIDVGEPSVDRIKKATRLSPVVKVYSFNSKSDTWWDQERDKFKELSAGVFQFPWGSIRALAALVKNRTMVLSATITGDTAYIGAEQGECEVSWVALQGGE
ncbi:MAG: YaeQ family protein [Proteobacteria bacterium]|nr:YaeQ family protein [Pseudomonadota bacterium]MBU1737387.1 YaeQ family protein [Pseudomonadota bacterium]